MFEPIKDMKILIIGVSEAHTGHAGVLGDSWVDYLPDFDSETYILCSVSVKGPQALRRQTPGASLLTLETYLVVELLQEAYDRVIVIGGCNGVDNEHQPSILQAHPNLEIIRNDNWTPQYLLTDLTHPNGKGVERLLIRIKRITSK